MTSQLGVGKYNISTETLFVADLGADSLDAVELVMDSEQEFEINIPDDIVAKIRLVGQAVAYLEANFG